MNICHCIMDHDFAAWWAGGTTRQTRYKHTNFIKLFSCVALAYSIFIRES